MKKHLLIALMMCIGLSSIAAPWDLKTSSLGKVIDVSKPFSKSAFEDVTILWYSPEYYAADYWYPGQAAGYFLFLSLEGLQEATWELTIGIETSNGMKIFTFTVPGGYGTNWHDHVLDMSSQMGPGETIPETPNMEVIHWWIVS